MVKLTGRDVSFWQRVFIVTFAIVIVVFFISVPIFELPFTDASGVTSETTIKRSLIEHILIENFGIGISTP